MNKVVYFTAAAVTVACLVLAAEAQDTKTPTIKEVMGKLTKGPNSLTTTIGKELNVDEPTWDDIKKQSKEFCTFAEALGRNKPPKGDAKSWSTLTEAYADNAKSLSEAADKMDKKAAVAAHRKLQTACMNCHKAHRGK
ncbi:MAG: cytochrome C [Gemmataceae bacterium]